MQVGISPRAHCCVSIICPRVCGHGCTYVQSWSCAMGHSADYGHVQWVSSKVVASQCTKFCYPLWASVQNRWAQRRIVQTLIWACCILKKNNERGKKIYIYESCYPPKESMLKNPLNLGKKGKRGKRLKGTLAWDCLFWFFALIKHK